MRRVLVTTNLTEIRPLLLAPFLLVVLPLGVPLSLGSAVPGELGHLGDGRVAVTGAASAGIKVLSLLPLLVL